MVKPVFNFGQYILSNMQKKLKNQVFRTYFCENIVCKSLNFGRKANSG